jgi:hypothetical protein
MPTYTYVVYEHVYTYLFECGRVYVCLHLCMYVCMCIWFCMYVLCLWLCIYVCIYMVLYVCRYVSVYVLCMWLCIYVNIYVYVYIPYVCVYVYVCKYLRTYIRIGVLAVIFMAERMLICLYFLQLSCSFRFVVLFLNADTSLWRQTAMYPIHFWRQIGSCCVSYSAFKQLSWLTECVTLRAPVFRRTKHTASQRTQLRPIFGIPFRSFGPTFVVEVKKDKCIVVIRCCNTKFCFLMRTKSKTALFPNF